MKTNMKKYSEGFREKIKPKFNDQGQPVVEPFRDAQKALQNARFAEQLKEQFFSEAFQDILVKLFKTWLESEPHAVKEREYLYCTAMSLGSVKEMLIEYEMFGKNAEFIKAQEAQDKKEITDE